MYMEKYQEILNTLRVLFAGLSDKERWVILARHGILTEKSQTLEQVGKKLKVTRERVRQIEAVVHLKVKNNESAFTK